MSLNSYEIQDIIEKLQNGEKLPEDYQYKLFPTKQKEYELVYGGKMRKEDILANEDGVFPVPLQIDKIYNGERAAFDDGWRNMIVFGDNLQFLKTVYEDKDPLIRGKIKGKVKLIYIDPPFATTDEFQNKEGAKAYNDKKKGAEFVEFLRKRLIVAREILADDGSIYVHLDQKMSHYIKVLMDEVFGKQNFRNEIIWHYTGNSTPTKCFPKKHDVIFLYSKTGFLKINFNDILEPYSEKTLKRYNHVDEQGKKYKISALNGEQEVVFAKEGKYPDDVWDIPIPRAKNEVLGYPTQKPEDLITKIIKSTTGNDDIILDFFGGSGTTATVAEKLGRRWLVCDIGKFAYYTMQKRILDIENSKSLENKSKNYGKKAHSFMTVNTGKYDLEKLIKLEQSKYKEFVLKLFEAEPTKQKIKGFPIDGQRRDGGYCHIFPYWQYKETSVDETYIEGIHSVMGSQAGDSFYIIAPATKVAMFEDYLDIDNTRYYFLKVPYHVINELHKEKFKSFRQPQSKGNVNAVDNAVGFHFMRSPKVKSKLTVKGDDVIVKICEFSSEFVDDAAKAPLDRFQSFAMVIVDFAYDGENFAMDQAYFAEDLLPKKGKKKSKSDEDDAVDVLSEIITITELTLPSFKKAECGDKLALVYVDIYGNEFKETLAVI